ncbi:hypothetical protein [Nocardioides nitrophenolicus]|uniref:hypothetical protein n=1 Tax=Nocardioides nitrophenolicus TaxID=60489 RepID=UPI001959FD8A|nr:hypothetical protein [Nocardioides nitrophenolicus]
MAAATVTLGSVDSSGTTAHPTDHGSDASSPSNEVLAALPTTATEPLANSVAWVSVRARRHTTALGAEIPPEATAAYRRAEAVIASAAPACGLSWTLLAAVGRVTTEHGRAEAPIVGPLVRDRDRAPVSDTDAGLLDHDPVHDRAIGPMHLTPTMWAQVGVDADDDGVRDPQDLDDAALAVAVLLCSSSTDLSNAANLQAALSNLNQNLAFARRVLTAQAAYQAAEATQQEPTVLAVEPPGVVEPTPEPTVRAVEYWLETVDHRHWSELRQSHDPVPPTPPTAPTTPTATTTPTAVPTAEPCEPVEPATPTLPPSDGPTALPTSASPCIEAPLDVGPRPTLPTPGARRTPW